MLPYSCFCLSGFSRLSIPTNILRSIGRVQAREMPPSRSNVHQKSVIGLRDTSCIRYPVLRALWKQRAVIPAPVCAGTKWSSAKRCAACINFDLAAFSNSDFAIRLADSRSVRHLPICIAIGISIWVQPEPPTACIRRNTLSIRQRHQAA